MSPGGCICPCFMLFSPCHLSKPDLLCILGLAIFFFTSPVPRAEPQSKTFLNEGVNYPSNCSQLPPKSPSPKASDITLGREDVKNFFLCIGIFPF